MYQATEHPNYPIIILVLILVLLIETTIFSIWFTGKRYGSSFEIDSVEQIELVLPQLNFQKYNALVKASKLVIQ
ncbi:hypothetical protein COV81_05265 [Candidatus Peregrinibacteria bacterium CG11_big_fil_rev_8_21_14_0_20_41_10]|nr:MAG: hypothetical protein COV81_05265 [Candidatus Peregrinibacteria bacterium CG11_big_fil_rev_8_21_14_0_20_41_10]PIZ73973.1 MAG: hypothetical protein COY06_04760 [Candidatus Peregrinibacteria bacterium CG_4_10_14_0_2_um_filter_41_8]PJC38320.1 MAG: hypothetical protein CO045_00940 [Candidatus Peregrinibacteria bacterium CG_4_9_14_0_2_um_filter_41_14]